MLRRRCYRIILTASVLVFLAVFFMGPSLVDLFSPRGSEVYEIATRGLSIFVFSFLFCGYNIFTSAFFTALSNGILSALISFSRTFVFLLIGLLVLPRHFGVTGVWATVPLAELITVAMATYMLARNGKRRGYS